MKRRSRHKLSLAVATAVLCACMSACSDSQFGGGGGGISTALQKKNRKSADDSEQLGTSSQEEDDTADEPVEVSGAYFTCLSDPDLATSAAEFIGVGCNVLDSEYKRMDLALVNAAFTVEDAEGKDTGAVFKPADTYSVTTEIPQALRDSLSVVVRMELAGKLSVLQSKITDKADDPIAVGAEEVDPPGVKTFGRQSDFHLGDGNFKSSNNADCQQTLQPANVIGRKITVEFEVKSDNAKITILVSEMCGIETNDNEVAITGSSFFLPDKEFDKGAKEFSFADTSLKKGKYALEIRSDAILGNYDDFLVGKITFTALEGDVEYKDPVASN